MKLYISDLHFGHAHVIQFDQRPFADSDEMDRVMIECWNFRVDADDDVYIVGDFCFRCDRAPDWYGSWHIYGHIHGHKDDVYRFMNTRERALNASACINNYTPASISELIRNNKAFQERP